MFNGLPELRNHGSDSSLEILFFTSSLSKTCYSVEKQLFETIIENNLPIKVTKIDIKNNPEIAEKHDVVVCPTLVFRDFIKVDGCCTQEELEEILSWYFFKSVESF